MAYIEKDDNGDILLRDEGTLNLSGMYRTDLSSQVAKILGVSVERTKELLRKLKPHEQIQITASPRN